MKVIKTGLTETWGPEERICVECRAVLEVSLEDLFSWEEIDDRFGGTFNQGGYKCPLCDHVNYLDGIPSSLLKKLRRKS